MPRRRLKATEYTAGWVCALPIELAAAQAMLDEEYEGPPADDHNSDCYTFGRIGSHNIVIVCLPAGRMGIAPATASAVRMLSTFKSIRCGLMVGVGGGVPSAEADIRLGDVVVSQPSSQHGGVVQYDAGKTGRGGHFTRTGSLNTPPKLLLNAVSQLRAAQYRIGNDRTLKLDLFGRLPQFSRDAAGPDILFEAAYEHSGGATCELCNKHRRVVRTTRRIEDQVTIHYGTIASGNQVMKDGTTRDRLSKKLGGVLCYEMEAAGLMNDFPCLVVRGVCDYADSHKNKAWQPYAAATAAACAKEILLLVPTVKVSAAEIAETCYDYHIPFSLKNVPVGKFADRPRDMEALEGALLPQKQTEGRRTLVMHGLGGIGKTQLAVAFVRRHQKKFSSVLWLDGSGKSSLKQSIASFADRVPIGQIPETSRLYATGNGGDIDMVVKDMLGWLSTADNNGWLVVLDNVDRDYRNQGEDAEAFAVDAYLPEADHGSVLITTRLPWLGQLGERWEVKKVDEEQAQVVFEAWYGKSIGNESAELLRLLDGLPLAITQAAAYMSETAVNFQTYTRLYKDQWRELMKSQDGPLWSYANGGVATTWMISYKTVRAKSEVAANLLLLWAHLDNKSLWWGLLTAASRGSATSAEKMPVWLMTMAKEEIEFLEAVRILRSYSLVDCTAELNVYATHPVVHQWAWHIQEECLRAEMSRLAIILVGYAIPNDDDDRYWEKQVRLLPHVERCKERLEDMELDENWQDSHSRAATKLGNLYADQGRLVEAEQLYQRALQGKALGPEHTSTLHTVNNLGILYASQGKLVEAEQMYQRALKGYEKAWGPEDPSTLNTVNNLGNLYLDQGKLAEAEQMYQRALQGKEKALGPEQTSTLDTVNNLGNLYAEQGKLAEAEQMFQRALQGYERTLDPRFFTTYVPLLNTKWGFASLFERQHRVQEAKKWYLEALLGYELVFGADHPECKKLRQILAALNKKKHRNNSANERGLAGEQSSAQITGESNSNLPNHLPKSKRYKLLRRLGWRKD